MEAADNGYFGSYDPESDRYFITTLAGGNEVESFNGEGIITYYNEYGDVVMIEVANPVRRALQGGFINTLADIIEESQLVNLDEELVLYNNLPGSNQNATTSSKQSLDSLDRTMRSVSIIRTSVPYTSEYPLEKIALTTRRN